MTNIEITLEETQALLSWEISGDVSHVITQSCDVDSIVSPPCVNTTVHYPLTVNPATVDIPVGATQYRFDLFLYDGTDLVMTYAESNGTHITRPGKTFYSFMQQITHNLINVFISMSKNENLAASIAWTCTHLIYWHRLC